MFYIHVLRIKCETLPQGDLLRSSDTPSSIIVRSIEFKPTADVGRGSEWHIGNVKNIGEGGVAFAMGRKQAVTVQQFDDSTHDFLEEEAMRAPFTFGVFDEEIQVCGIIRKAGVSQNTSQIANKLATLLNAAPFAERANSIISVEPIQDPVGFIEAIHRSKAVIRFSFTVSRPNPIDVDRLIQGPAKEFTQEVGGETSTIETEGMDLNKDVIEEIANAVAADGEKAAATIRPSEGGLPKRIHITGNPVTEPVEPDPDASILSAVLEGARRAYRRVRRNPVNNG
ncbi:hypothetical protein [Sphingomonas sp. CROZ-RG-20F-R02-07]|uniref:hypothetical protein n=1 Tax=Sphingomonas sp. CROZ-RG-20F-R02-07 TaxID=2914832 RepID=UPI001F59377D|nr:hypothetical protein [Sphingomonas sp. CROZ-RG-20F-R02-07]